MSIIKKNMFFYNPGRLEVKGLVEKHIFFIKNSSTYEIFNLMHNKNP